MQQAQIKKLVDVTTSVNKAKNSLLESLCLVEDEDLKNPHFRKKLRQIYKESCKEIMDNIDLLLPLNGTEFEDHPDPQIPEKNNQHERKKFSQTGDSADLHGPNISNVNCNDVAQVHPSDIRVLNGNQVPSRIDIDGSRPTQGDLSALELNRIHQWMRDALLEVSTKWIKLCHECYNTTQVIAKKLKQEGKLTEESYRTQLLDAFLPSRGVNGKDEICKCMREEIEEVDDDIDDEEWDLTNPLYRVNDYYLKITTSDLIEKYGVDAENVAAIEESIYLKFINGRRNIKLSSSEIDERVQQVNQLSSDWMDFMSGYIRFGQFPDIDTLVEMTYLQFAHGMNIIFRIQGELAELRLAGSIHFPRCFRRAPPNIPKGFEETWKDFGGIVRKRAKGDVFSLPPKMDQSLSKQFNMPVKKKIWWDYYESNPYVDWLQDLL